MLCTVGHLSSGQLHNSTVLVGTHSRQRIMDCYGVIDERRNVNISTARTTVVRSPYLMHSIAQMTTFSQIYCQRN